MLLNLTEMTGYDVCTYACKAAETARKKINPSQIRSQSVTK